MSALDGGKKLASCYSCLAPVESVSGTDWTHNRRDVEDETLFSCQKSNHAHLTSRLVTVLTEVPLLL